MFVAQKQYDLDKIVQDIKKYLDKLDEKMAPAPLQGDPQSQPWAPDQTRFYQYLSVMRQYLESELPRTIFDH